jgi:hypothetical protein
MKQPKPKTASKSAPKAAPKAASKSAFRAYMDNAKYPEPKGIKTRMGLTKTVTAKLKKKK